MRKLLCLLTVLSLSLPLSGCIDGCGSSSPRYSRPSPPRQTPGPSIVEHSANQAQADSALEVLNDRQRTIENEMRKWRLTSNSTRGPQFPGEPSTLEQQIRQRCNRLEREAQNLKRQTFIREHKGAVTQLDRMIQFAQDTRDELSGQP